jgi:hypothetical protein
MTVLGRHAAAIPALTAVLVLSACALSGPPLARQGAGTAAAPSAAGSATPFPAPAEAAAPAAAPPPYVPPS